MFIFTKLMFPCLVFSHEFKPTLTQSLFLGLIIVNPLVVRPRLTLPTRGLKSVTLST